MEVESDNDLTSVDSYRNDKLWRLFHALHLWTFPYNFYLRHVMYIRGDHVCLPLGICGVPTDTYLGRPPKITEV